MAETLVCFHGSKYPYFSQKLLQNCICVIVTAPFFIPSLSSDISPLLFEKLFF